MTTAELIHHHQPLQHHQQQQQQQFHQHHQYLHLHHSNGTMASSNITSAAAVPPSTKLNITDVAMHFGREYYTMLSREPERLHCFYSKQSSLFHSHEEDLETAVCVGLEEIHQKIVSAGFAGARVVIASIDSQPSMNGGILVVVIGSMHMRSGAVKKFVQSFFLAEQPNGYFVLNDVLRFLSAPEQLAVPAAASPSVVSAAPPPAVPSQPPVPPPVATPPKSASPAKEVLKSEAALQKYQSRQKKPVKSEEKAPSTEETAQSSPSSWAALAAVQQNKWGSGVVAENKIPVASIPVEEQKPASSGYVNYRTGSFKARENRDEGREPRNRPSRERKTAHSSERLPEPEAAAESPSEKQRSQKFTFDPAKSVFVTNIKGEIDSSHLRTIFEAVGTLISFDAIPPKGIAFVEYETSEAAQLAIASSLFYNEVQMSVKPRRPQSAHPRHGGRPRSGPRPSRTDTTNNRS